MEAVERNLVNCNVQQGVSDETSKQPDNRCETALHPKLHETNDGAHIASPWDELNGLTGCRTKISCKGRCCPTSKHSRPKPLSTTLLRTP